jgi:site-specific recombinase XerD
MKQLILHSTNFNYLIEGFTQWMQLIGYADTTASTLPVHVREFLHYIEDQKRITHITQLKSRHVNDFVRHLKYRPNLHRGGALSASHVNKTLQAVNTFARYLNQTGKHVLDITIKRMPSDVDERTVLTVQEIKKLYEATFTGHGFNARALGQRDRAMIAIFYSCGLRKDEGTKLNISDVDLVRRTVFVRKGKGNKQRYVPIAGKACSDIEAYLQEGRNWFLNDNRSLWHSRQGWKKQDTHDESFFLNLKGQRMKAFYHVFLSLKERAGIEKEFSTHHLRHSIATHLLQGGMKIEEIAKFLGHSSLESTQIYTHIVQQLNKQHNENLLSISER